MDRQPGLVWAFLISALLMTACGGGGGGDSAAIPAGPAPGTPAFTAPDGADLSAVTLAAPMTQSLGRVEVTGLPEGLETADVYANYYVLDGDITSDAGDDPRVLPLFTLDDTVYLLPPLLDADGASIVVVMTDGASRSEAFALEIEPLPPGREGAIEEVEVAVNRLLKAATQALGKDYPEEWEGWRDASLNLMPEYLLPLMRAWQAIADPENENALVNRDFDEDTRVLLERIFAAIPIADVLAAQAAYIESGDSLLDEAANSMMLRTSSVRRSQQSTGTQSASALRKNTLSVLQTTQPASRVELDGLLEIPDAPSLKDRLEDYVKAREMQESLELFDETVGTYLATVATVASLPITGGAGTLGVTAARLGALEAVTNITSTLVTAAGVAQWFLPCCIVDLDVTLDPAGGQIANEDGFENQIRLRDARALAESEGVNLTKEIMDRVTEKAAEVVNGSLSNAAQNVIGESASRLINDYGGTAIVERYLPQFQPGSDMVFIWADIDMVAGNVQRWLDVEFDTFASSGSPILEQAFTGSESYEFRLLAPEA